jgi:hypothetical protein
LAIITLGAIGDDLDDVDHVTQPQSFGVWDARGQHELSCARRASEPLLEAAEAELEVKGVRHAVRWACRQNVNSDGSLTLRHNQILSSAVGVDADRAVDPAFASL